MAIGLFSIDSRETKGRLKNQGNWFLDGLCSYNSGLLFPHTQQRSFHAVFSIRRKIHTTQRYFAVDGRFGRRAQKRQARQYAWRRQSGKDC